MAGDGKTGRGGVDVASFAVKALAVLVAVVIGLSLSMAVFGGGEEDPRGGPFALVDGEGRPATEALLRDEISLVYFGFTHCPDICPTELANMVAARRVARERGFEPQIVFIGVDPKRDTPEMLVDYLQAFGDGLIGLSGTEEQLLAAGRAYGARFFAEAPEGEDPLDYEVVHTTLLYAVGPDARVFWRFPGATPPEVIADRLEAQRDALKAAGRLAG